MKHPAASGTDPFAALKQAVRWMWSLGDYTALASLLEPCAQRLAIDLDIGPGSEVLDVAAGNGNFALAAAGRGARVVACDLAPAMLELGRPRTAAAGVDVEWREADVEALPFDDASFDVVASVFGAMFAPRPRQAAIEMFRVTRPSGLVGMANYADAGFLGGFAQLLSRYSRPSPLELPSPFAWGNEDEVRGRFAGLASSVETRHDSLAFRFPSVEAGLAFWERTNPPLVALRGTLPREDYARFIGDARALMEDLNTGAGGELVLESGYLAVIARK